MSVDFLFNLTPGDIVYDIETYPNVFTCTFIHCKTEQIWYFEISNRHDNRESFCQFIDIARSLGCRSVGFNNLGFDYPVIHFIYKNRHQLITPVDIYKKAMSIINAPHNARFSHMVWESDRVIPQIDLYKIHHLDNVAKATSLKVLEFNMRMNNVEDLPFDVGTHLIDSQIDILKRYNLHDCYATLQFYHETLPQIQFREQLGEKYHRDFLNHNDTKIGKDYFIMKLEEVDPGCCYKIIDGKRQIQQTKRDRIALGDIILPYIQFDQSEFQRVLNWFKFKVISETKGSIKDVNCTINGFQFDFGTGGIHGSVESQILYSDDEYVIEDWDVASYYPNLAIANDIHPAHLGQTFCTIYKELYEQRKLHKKGTAENAMLKLALNGVYGDSNNQYSPFYDPQYTMSITINGQLLLCLLAEKLMQLGTLQMVQINTDGLTIRYPRQYRYWVHQVCTWWEQLTNLELESAIYNRFMVRDVNNYIAEYEDGSVKRKGCYEYELDWHQNHSALIVPKAAEAALVHGVDIETFIRTHDDLFDFYLRTKVPRSSSLEWGGDQVANTVRYYISNEGKPLEKIMPPAGPSGAYKKKNGVPDHYYREVLKEVGSNWDERIHTKNKSTYAERRTAIHTGWCVQLCNDLNEHHFLKHTVNYDWYIKEVEKIVKPLLD